MSESFEEHRKGYWNVHENLGWSILVVLFAAVMLFLVSMMVHRQLNNRLETLEQAYQIQLEEEK